MERMDVRFKGTLALIALALATQAFTAEAEEAEAERSPAKAEASPTPAPLPAAIVPQFSFRARDGEMLAKLMQKNKWFNEFRQTPFYQGAVGRLAPVLFAPADDHGSMAGAWQGRLLDFLYAKLLENRPVALHYVRRSQVASPYAVTIQGLSSAETKLAEKMIQNLKTADAVKLSYRDAGEVAVTPILVKQQRFGASLNGNCLAIGRDPAVIASASYQCRQAQVLASDAEVRFSLDESFPAFRGLRQKFLGVNPEGRVDFKWQDAEARFISQGGAVAVGDTALQKAALTEDLLRAVPSDAIFVSTAMVPVPSAGFGPEGLRAYFKSNKVDLKKAPTMPVTLVYFPVPRERGSLPGTAILFHVPKNAPSTVQQLAASYPPTKQRETYVRQTCPGVVALSEDKKALDALESVCKKERPSFSQRADKWTSPLKTSFSGAAFVNPGKLLSLQMERGWKVSTSGEVASEIQSARNLVEQLPSYLFIGTADAKSIGLKAVE